MTDSTPDPTDADRIDTTTGNEVPLPSLDAAPADWTDATTEAIMRGARAAPDQYHVRAYIATATGHAHEVMVVPDDATVTDSPSVVVADDDAPTPAEHAALYEVRVPATPFLSYNQLATVEDRVCDHHAQVMAELGDEPGERTPGLISPDPEQTYTVELGSPHPNGVNVSVGK